MLNSCFGSYRMSRISFIFYCLNDTCSKWVDVRDIQSGNEAKPNGKGHGLLQFIASFATQVHSHISVDNYLQLKKEHGS